MRSEIRGVQGFGAKSGDGKDGETIYSKIELKTLIVFFRTRYKSFAGLETIV